MDASAPISPGRIFISYRREDAAYPAGWLFDRLEIEAALTRNVLVIPVLVEGAQMPGQSGCRPAWRNWRIGKPRSLAGAAGTDCLF